MPLSGHEDARSQRSNSVLHRQPYRHSCRGAPLEKRAQRFDQDRAGLHHFCFRARSNEDVDLIYEFVANELDAKVIHGPEEGEHFAPGYYSILFEDPDGIRVEVNHVPGQGHFASGGRLGEGGSGPASMYGEDGLTDPT